MTTWDVQSGACKQILRAQPGAAMEGMFPTLEDIKPSVPFDYGLDDLRAVPPTAACSMQALHAPFGTNCLITGGGSGVGGCAWTDTASLFAGSDRKLRFWDTANSQNSFTVNGGTASAGHPMISPHAWCQGILCTQSPSG